VSNEHGGPGIGRIEVRMTAKRGRPMRRRGRNIDKRGE
jgi:hypothetical protein